jgi:hypothetical protein
MKFETVVSTAEHQAFLNDLKEILGKHQHLRADVMLAITSQFVGMLIAFQDQTLYTNEVVMQLVSANIKTGNNEAIKPLLNSQGSA